MKSHSIWTLKTGAKISNFNLRLKYASTQPKKYQVQVPIKEHDEPIQTLSQPVGRSRKKALFLPDLSKNRLQNLQSVTGIAVALNHVGWANISIPDLRVSNWNSFTLPSNFLDSFIETDILELAHTVRAKIPSSDLYVMEYRPYRWTCYPNDICLRSMLISLLSDSKNDSKDPKMVFQRPSLINNIHSLVIGGERMSVKEVLIRRNLLKIPGIASEKELKNRCNDCYSLINIPSDHILSFANFSREKQESLSLVLLIALTFLDVAVFQNPQSINKIQKKHPHRTIIDPS